MVSPFRKKISGALKTFKEGILRLSGKIAGRISLIKTSLRRISLRRIIIIAAILLILLPSVLIVVVFTGMVRHLPAKQELLKIQNPLATEIYSADTVLMGRYYIQNRQYLKPGEITVTLRNALVATEDVRFYSHNGIDIRSLVRVAVKTLLMSKESSGGGSTLTQQLVKNLYPREEMKFFNVTVNKLWEMVVARKIEKIYTKDEILELYLSTVPFGEDTFGIETASMQFFNKNPMELKTEEAALLIGMLKANNTFNPVINPNNALARRNTVISQMTKYGYIEKSEADSLIEIPVMLQYSPLPHDAGIAPYLREIIRGEMAEWCSQNYKDNGEPYNLYSDGLRIYTTIDSRLQQYAEMAVRDHISRLQMLFDEQWKGKNLWSGVPMSQVLVNYDGEYRPEMETEEPEKMEVFTWDGNQEIEYNTLDSIKHYLSFLQSGFLAMEVATGEIRAWVGGINYKYFKYDHVTAKRQAGSTFKPVVYLTALEQGMSPCDFLPNDSIVYEEYEGWTPRNADRTYGGFYSLKGALVNSVNTVSAGLIMETGIDPVIAMAHRAGITSPLPVVPSLALGTGEVSLYEMVRFYQAVANKGISMEPVWISSIEDKDGNLLFREEKTGNGGTPVCDPANAEIMTEMLRGVVNRGTAAALRSQYGIYSDIAGKTGTTQNYSDGWFIGFTPDLVAGVWVGGDIQNIRFREMSYGQGAFAAMPVWAGFIKHAYADDRWGYLQHQIFDISDSTRSILDCDDFRETKPFGYDFLKELTKKPFFKRLFRRRR
ncbi:MAG: penicillin-binding protein 1A [Bacteroidales bacterium]